MTVAPDYVLARLDLFPANVQHFVDGTRVASWLNTRIIVTMDEVFVWGEGPALLYDARLDDFTGDNTHGWTAVVGSECLTISRGSGCGCGSRLRGFRPFGDKPIMQSPR